MPDMVPVTSSNIREVGFDKVSNILYVTFHSGSSYEYFGVSENEFNNLLSASSKGQYFYYHIRDNYRYKCIG